MTRDADLLDERYGRPGSEGLDVIIRGMQLASPDDHAPIRHTGPVFDGLCACLSREVLPSPR